MVLRKHWNCTVCVCAGMSYVYIFFVLHVSVVILVVYADSVPPSTPTSYISGASQQAVTNLK
jgi:hypothetical protein